MRLLTPLGLAAAALAVPLTLWYLLRARRHPVRVSSTFLWRRSGESVTAAVPWQRFRGDRTFWLVLAALLAGAVALARPALPVDTPLGAHTILIVDASASMLADEGGPTRLELARRRAEELIAELGPGQTISVLRAAERARVVVSNTSDAGAAYDAVRAVTPAQSAADLDDAVTLAAALTQPGQPTVIHLLTDHAPDESEIPRPPDGLRVTAVGSDRDNLAVTRMQAVPSGGAVRVFAQVRNFGTVPARARLTLSTGDGVELASQGLRLAARAHEDVVLDIDAAGASVLQATVSPTGDPGDDAPGDVGGDDRPAGASADALALDDTAAAVVAGDQERTAVVAGPGNVFVEQALRAAGVEVRTEPEVPDDLRGVDLLVIDRIAAPAEPPLPTIAVAPTRPFDGVTAAAPVDDPVTTFQPADHPLVADVDLSQLAVASATPVQAADLTPIAAGPDGTLIAAGRIGGQPVIHVGFDLLASSLPLDVAWPVLVSNAVDWLTGAAATAPAQVGAPLPLTAPAGAREVEVTAPDGHVQRLDVADPPPHADQVGVWQARWLGVDAAPTLVAVHAAASESDLVATRPAADAATAGTGTARGLRVFGPGIAAVVLALLLAEWVLAHRRPQTTGPARPRSAGRRWPRALPPLRPRRLVAVRRRRASGRQRTAEPSA